LATEYDPFCANVSVIVLNYNRATTTVECLAALAEAPSELIREVIVVDNGSDPDELSILREQHARGGFALLEIGKNRFFGEGNNIGVDNARGEYVVFLNNDAFVQPGWIEALSSTMRDDADVAAVGPMFLYPDGRVQEVGAIALPTGDVVQVGKGAVWGPDHYDTPFAVDFCSAACLMMRRADFLAVGGFGFEWEPAYYEDADLCLKLRTRFGKVMVNPAARVVHIESRTTSDARLQLHNISEINRARFAAKWGPWLEARQDHLPTEVAPRTEVLSRTEVLLPGEDGVGPHRPGPVPDATDPSIVLYSPYQLVPGGGERVMFELASHFTSRFGMSQVAIATPYRYSTTRLRQIAATFGLEHGVGTPLPWAEIDPDRCRLSVVVGNTILPPTRAFGERCVYQLQFPFWVPDQEIEERGTWLGDFDEIWVYSDFVRRNVNGLVRHYRMAAPPIRVITPPAAWPGAQGGLPWSERRTIVSVGRFFAGGHNKRQDVVIEAFRRIVEAGGEGVELALAGTIHPSPAGRARFYELQELAADLPCTFYPNIGRHDLADLYRRSAVLIHAAGFGVDPDEFPEALEHFGITPIEAACFGCIPVVYGQGGPLDVIRALGCDTAFSTVEECARIVTGLLRDASGSAGLSAHVRRSSQIYSAAAFQFRVDEALRELGVV
jgi:GT2 family glycosyltransferase/glycosyltransferase involved in cell wall biosynthesis